MSHVVPCVLASFDKCVVFPREDVFRRGHFHSKEWPRTLAEKCALVDKVGEDLVKNRKCEDERQIQEALGGAACEVRAG